MVDLELARRRRDEFRDAFARALRAGEPDSDRATDLGVATDTLVVAALEAAREVEGLIAEIDRLRAENDVVFRGLEAATEALTRSNAQAKRGLGLFRRLTDHALAQRDQLAAATAEVQQWRATYGEDALRHATAVLAERNALRRKLADREALLDALAAERKGSGE